jgi:hypothetical protein
MVLSGIQFFGIMKKPNPLDSGLNPAGMTDTWYEALKSPL